ncbi:MAG: hypothetical protein OIF32_05290 [Campylobacterales bacterium]|nr:hypothetical protein [Campylobacterales bacterium]
MYNAMELSRHLQDHMAIMKDYYQTTGSGKVSSKTENKFDEIYDKSRDVDSSNAKEFLKSLDPKELKTLQSFHYLADKINVDSLSNEGAYNLLQHRYEQLDINGDGLVQSGVADLIPTFPQNMDNELKSSVVDSLKQMKAEGAPDKELFLVSSMLTFKFNSHTILAGVRRDLGIQDSVETPKNDYNSIAEIHHRMHNPLPGEHRSDEIINAFDKFFDILNQNYSGNKTTTSNDGKESSKTEEENDERSSIGKDFFDKVRADGGMLNYIQKENYRKIEEKIEEKKDELIEKYGEDNMNQIEKELTEYRKQLLKELEAKSEKKLLSNDNVLADLLEIF